MRSYVATDKDDVEEAARLHAEPWMLDLLALNPHYIFWGPHEDYMWKEGDGWDSAKTFATWSEFGPWKLNELNECVNFYFHVQRDSRGCATCGGLGVHPDAQWVSESFYGHSSPFGFITAREHDAQALMARFGGSPKGAHLHGSYPDAETLARYGDDFRAFCEEMRVHRSWDQRLTEADVSVLVEAGRWPADATLEKATADRSLIGNYSIDAINRWLLAKARCERFGIPHSCVTCDGEGSVFTAESARLSLTLWWLHPRKGCSRGLEIECVRQEEVPDTLTFLRAAAERNAERFAAVVKQNGAKP